MRILFVSQYFPPEVAAPAVRTHEHARQWVSMGHEVDVLTAFPHHPTGIVPDGYRGRIFMRESVDGINVVRTWIYATPNTGVVRRSLSYLSFLFSASLAGLRIGRPDVVIATSPQFLCAVAGFAIARYKRSPFVFEVRDLWPRSIYELGVVKRGPVIALLSALERWLYTHSDAIVAVADGTREILSREGVRPSKMHLIPNGVDVESFSPDIDGSAVRGEMDLDGAFVICWIGTHGAAHGLSTVLDAASMLSDERGIKFIFVGEGADKPRLEEEARRRGLSNVSFVGQQERRRVREFIAASDACLVHLRALPLFEHVLPSKTFEFMAVGKPVIMGLRGEARTLLEASGGGIAIEPESPGEMAEAILRLYRDPGLASEMGARGRSFVVDHYERRRLAADYIRVLEETLEPR